MPNLLGRIRRRAPREGTKPLLKMRRFTSGRHTIRIYSTEGFPSRQPLAQLRGKSYESLVYNSAGTVPLDTSIPPPKTKLRKHRVYISSPGEESFETVKALNENAALSLALIQRFGSLVLPGPVKIVVEDQSDWDRNTGVYYFPRPGNNPAQVLPYRIPVPVEGIRVGRFSLTLKERKLGVPFFPLSAARPGPRSRGEAKKDDAMELAIKNERERRRSN